MQMTHGDACASAAISLTDFAEKVRGWNSDLEWFSRSALSNNESPGGLLMSAVARDGNFEILLLRIQRAFTDVHIGYNLTGNPSRNRTLSKVLSAEGSILKLKVWTGIELVPALVRWQDRKIRQAPLNFPVPLKTRNFSSQWATVSFYGKTPGVRYDIDCRTEHISTVYMRAVIAMSR
jgi:hypothetical protein